MYFAALPLVRARQSYNHHVLRSCLAHYVRESNRVIFPFPTEVKGTSQKMKICNKEKWEYPPLQGVKVEHSTKKEICHFHGDTDKGERSPLNTIVSTEKIVLSLKR